MSGPSTYLADPDDPEGEPRSFAFDYSYWSFDGSRKEDNGYYGADMTHPNGKKFTGQVDRQSSVAVGVFVCVMKGGIIEYGEVS